VGRSAAATKRLRSSSSSSSSKYRGLVAGLIAIPLLLLLLPLRHISREPGLAAGRGCTRFAAVALTLLLIWYGRLALAAAFRFPVMFVWSRSVGHAIGRRSSGLMPTGCDDRHGNAFAHRHPSRSAGQPDSN
jgi:hypothetical protein